MTLSIFVWRTWLPLWRDSKQLRRAADGDGEEAYVEEVQTMAIELVGSIRASGFLEEDTRGEAARRRLI